MDIVKPSINLDVLGKGLCNSSCMQCFRALVCTACSVCWFATGIGDGNMVRTTSKSTDNEIGEFCCWSWNRSVGYRQSLHSLSSFGSHYCLAHQAQNQPIPHHCLSTLSSNWTWVWRRHEKSALWVSKSCQLGASHWIQCTQGLLATHLIFLRPIFAPDFHLYDGNFVRRTHMGTDNETGELGCWSQDRWVGDSHSLQSLSSFGKCY